MRYCEVEAECVWLIALAALLEYPELPRASERVKRAAAKVACHALIRMRKTAKQNGEQQITVLEFFVN